MAEDEVAALKEALCNQYIVMRKLYIELEEEREASATAASEALSMILRLQREKATEKMEACQYKRMTEEKMHYAEVSLTILKEVMQLRELEIGTLKYQLEAYKHKLLSLGVDDLDIGEMRTSENPFSSGNIASFDKTRFSGLLRRNISLPVFRLEQLYGDLDSIDKDVPLHLTKQSMWKETEAYKETKIPYLFEDYVNDYCSSDFKQAEEVKERAKVSLETKKIEDKFSSESSLVHMEPQKTASINPMSSEEDSSSCSWHSAVNGEGISTLPLQAEDLENISASYMPHRLCMESGSNENMYHPLNVHDAFEVQESYNGYKLREASKFVLDEPISQAKNMIGMPGLMPREAVDYIFKDDDESLNKTFMYTYHGKKAHTPKKNASVHHGSKMSASRKGTSVTFHQAHLEPKMGISIPTADFEQVKQRVKQLDNERITLEEDSKTSKEQMKLLREIFEQLNTIESHIKRINTRKSPSHPSRDESSIVSVMEAVLSFSI